jgi:hypothetical protein
MTGFLEHCSEISDHLILMVGYFGGCFGFRAGDFGKIPDFDLEEGKFLATFPERIDEAESNGRIFNR